MTSSVLNEKFRRRMQRKKNETTRAGREGNLLTRLCNRTNVQRDVVSSSEPFDSTLKEISTR